MECFVIVFLSETQPCNLEQSIATIELLVRVFSDLFKMKDRVRLLGGFVFKSFRQHFTEVEVSFNVRSIFLNDALKISKSLLEFTFVVPRQATLHVTLLVELLVVGLGFLLRKHFSCNRVCFRCLGEVFHRLVTVTDAKIATKRVLVQSDELLEVLECHTEIFLQEVGLTTSKVGIRIGGECLDALQ